MMWGQSAKLVGNDVILDQQQCKTTHNNLFVVTCNFTRHLSKLCISSAQRPKTLNVWKNDQNMFWLLLKSHNVFWHLKKCHDAKFVSWLLKKMTTTHSGIIKCHNASWLFSFTAIMQCETIFNLSKGSCCLSSTSEWSKVEVGRFYSHICW